MEFVALELELVVDEVDDTVVVTGTRDVVVAVEMRDCVLTRDVVETREVVLTNVFVVVSVTVLACSVVVLDPILDAAYAPPAISAIIITATIAIIELFKTYHVIEIQFVFTVIIHN